MGRQVSFFLLPEDLRVIEDAITSTGPVIFLPDVSAEPQVVTLASIELPQERMGKERLRVHVTRPDFVRKVRFKQMLGQQHFIIEPGSPVIQLDRSFFDGSRIRHGRLYFRTGSDADPEFVKWGEKVLRAVRSVLVRSPESPTEYLGPSAHDWIKRTNARTQPGVAVLAGSI
jgi:hypothetical protein